MPLSDSAVYSAEQIVIPSDLGDILKAYSKEVIRNEPENIYEFSAQYFAQFVTSEARISTDQLISLRQRLGAGEDCVGQAQLYEATAEVAIPSAAVDKVLQLGDFGDDVNWKEFAVLMLSLEGEDAMQAVQLIFEVFSDEGDATLPTDTFLELLRPFAARDPVMMAADGIMDALSEELAQSAAAKNGLTSFDDFAAAPVLASL